VLKLGQVNQSCSVWLILIRPKLFGLGQTCNVKLPKCNDTCDCKVGCLNPHLRTTPCTAVVFYHPNHMQNHAPYVECAYMQNISFRALPINHLLFGSYCMPAHVGILSTAEIRIWSMIIRQLEWSHSHLYIMLSITYGSPTHWYHKNIIICAKLQCLSLQYIVSFSNPDLTCIVIQVSRSTVMTWFLCWCSTCSLKIIVYFIRPSFRKILKQGRIKILRELGGAKVTQKVLLMHGKDRVE